MKEGDLASYKWYIWPLIIVVVIVSILRIATPVPATLLQSANRGSLFVKPEARGNYAVGEHIVSLTETSISMNHPDVHTNVWANPIDGSFLSAAWADMTITNTKGMLRVKEGWSKEKPIQSIDRVFVGSLGDLWLFGSLRQPDESGADKVSYSVQMKEEKTTGIIELKIKIASSRVNRLIFSSALDSDEHLFGGGITYTSLDNRAILSLPRVQGVGRGDQPITLIQDLIDGNGGSIETSPGILPRFVSDAPRSQWAKTTNPVVIDNSKAKRVSFISWDNELTVRIGNGANAKEQLIKLGKESERMKKPPAWARDGLIVGAKGESEEEVINLVDKWIVAGLNPKGIWLEHLPKNLSALKRRLKFRDINLIGKVPYGREAPISLEGAILTQIEEQPFSLQRNQEALEWVKSIDLSKRRRIKPLVITEALTDDLVSNSMVANVGEFLANYSANDGLLAAHHALVNSSLSGIPYTELTIGGDTTIERPKILGSVKRDKDFIARSAQLGVFSTDFRLGLDEVDNGVNLSDPEIMPIIKRWYNLHYALAPIRNRLIEEADLTGIGPIRDPIIVLDDNRRYIRSHPCFFYGEDIFVVPVLEKGLPAMTINLPEGKWRNVFTGEIHNINRGSQGEVLLKTSLDTFPLYTRVDSSSDKVLEMWSEHHVLKPEKPNTN